MSCTDNVCATIQKIRQVKRFVTKPYIYISIRYAYIFVSFLFYACMFVLGVNQVDVELTHISNGIVCLNILDTIIPRLAMSNIGKIQSVTMKFQCMDTYLSTFDRFILQLCLRSGLSTSDNSMVLLGIYIYWSIVGEVQRQEHPPMLCWKKRKHMHQ